MTLILIRHGESRANEIDKSEPLFCGRWNVPLTEHGKAQARALQGHPAILGADALYSSPLLRAIETAKEFYDREIFVDERLTERTLGVFDGRNIQELKADPAYSHYFTDPRLADFRASFRTRAPGGENYTDVTARVSSFLEDLKKQNYKKVILVSHYAAIRCMIKLVKNLSEEETLALKISHCEPIQLEL
ncbi:MAG: histidine phosphatase family protein [Clostridia bacterium]|nr:histidine phosphatase family protein [Clostridia bacterium]